MPNKKRHLVAALACRNQGSRLYGKPMQNLDINNSIRIIDHIIACLNTICCIDEVVLGIAEGVDNEVFKSLANSKGIRWVEGDEIDVLSRLCKCGRIAAATDIFRVTSESPFLYFEEVESVWRLHCSEANDATFMDDIIDGCGFEIIRYDALVLSHEKGCTKHRSEMCTLYIRENLHQFKVFRVPAPTHLVRPDLRLTVDNPEDLAVCRRVYKHFKNQAPKIKVSEIVKFLDANPKLIEMIAPFTKFGYSSMYL